MGIFKKKDYSKYVTIALFAILIGLSIEIYRSFTIIQMGMKQWFLLTIFGMVGQILIEKYFRE
jgi:general stress protein CsbA